MTETASFDVLIIGGGPGGYGAALYATSAGLQVAVVEQDTLGGTCLNRGCIPAKAFLETAAMRRHAAHAADFGVNVGDTSVDFGVAQRRKQRVVDEIVKGLSGFMASKKITVFNGVGRLGAGRQVTVAHADGTSSTVTGTHVILAAGSVPRLIPGFEPSPPGQPSVVMTSDEVLALDHVPGRLAVIGGGAIGCEFASTFADLGAKVTILEGLPKILPGLDADVANVVVRSFRKRGIDIRTGVTVQGHRPAEDGRTTTILLGEGGELEVDAVVVSIGRRPYADRLGLDGTAVQVSDRGFVQVDEYCRTGEDGVFAIGDLIATPQLAHVAYAEAILVVKQILGEPALPVDYSRVPWAIYCSPEVAFVGPSEEAAKEAGLDVVVAKHQFRANSRAKILGEVDGLVKVIAKRAPDGGAGQIVGVHMVGPWVTEQLSGGYLAVNWEATVDEVAAFIQPHPSLTELFGETVLSLTGRSLNV